MSSRNKKGNNTMGNIAAAVFMYKILVLWVSVFFFDSELKKSIMKKKGLLPVRMKVTVMLPEKIKRKMQRKAWKQAA
jgi:hypothetical protein